MDGDFVKHVILNSDTQTKRFHSGKHYSFNFDPDYKHSDYSLVMYVDNTVINMDTNGHIHSAEHGGNSITKTRAEKYLSTLKDTLIGIDKD